MGLSARRTWLRRIAGGLVILLALGTVSIFTWIPIVLVSYFNSTIRTPSVTVTQETAAMHQELFVADLHCDALMWRRDILTRSNRGHVDVPRMIEGNMALQIFTTVTCVPTGANMDRTENQRDVILPLAIAQRWPLATWTSMRERALYQADKFSRAAARSQGALRLIRSREDLDEFVAQRAETRTLTAGILGIEGLHCLEGKFENLGVMFDAGFRVMGPVHFFDNEVGGSAHGVEKGGLTDFGRKVVAEMERRSIVIDLAHASPALFDDVLDAVTRPVIVSHTGVKGTYGGNRNLSDGQVKRIAENGGIVGIGFWIHAVGGEDVASIVRAMRYVADRVGVEHVALGSDYDGHTRVPFDASGAAQLTQGLRDGGFTKQEIEKIMGGNVLRVLREALP